MSHENISGSDFVITGVDSRYFLVIITADYYSFASRYSFPKCYWLFIIGPQLHCSGRVPLGINALHE